MNSFSSVILAVLLLILLTVGFIGVCSWVKTQLVWWRQGRRFDFYERWERCKNISGEKNGSFWE